MALGPFHSLRSFILILQFSCTIYFNFCCTFIYFTLLPLTLYTVYTLYQCTYFFAYMFCFFTFMVTRSTCKQQFPPGINNVFWFWFMQLLVQSTWLQCATCMYVWILHYSILWGTFILLLKYSAVCIYSIYYYNNYFKSNKSELFKLLSSVIVSSVMSCHICAQSAVQIMCNIFQGVDEGWTEQLERILIFAYYVRQ